MILKVLSSNYLKLDELTNKLKDKTMDDKWTYIPNDKTKLTLL